MPNNSRPAARRSYQALPWSTAAISDARKALGRARKTPTQAKNGIAGGYQPAARQPLLVHGAGIAQNEQPGLGRQLSRRVNAGEIDQGTANQTNADRRLLENAFGKDWRIHVYGSRGLTRRTREALAKNPSDPTYQALYARLMEDRKRALEKAREVVGDE